MIRDFFDSMRCVLPDEMANYRELVESWGSRDCHVALMPAISWQSGVYNLFDQRAGLEGRDMVWLVPAGQHSFWWLPMLRKAIVEFYETDEMDMGGRSGFPGIEEEELEECILLRSDDLQGDPERCILGANALLIRLSLSSLRETLVLILLDHQDDCWTNVIERHRIGLTWLVDSGRGTGDYYVQVNLYQLMQRTAFPETLPALYFKGLYNKGEVPDGFRFLYAMLSEVGPDGYDKWRSFSAVYDTGWRC